MKTSRFCLSFMCLALLAATASADQVTFDIDVEQAGAGDLYNGVFMGASDAEFGVVAVNFVSIELATTWGGEVLIELTSPDGQVWTFMNDEADGLPTPDGNFDMGVAGGNGTLSNVATYNFVESGGNTAWPENLAAAGDYNTNIGGNGALGWAAGPFDAGDWSLRITDTVAGDTTSAGSVVFDFTAAVPEPGSTMFLIGGLGLVALRRRR